MQSELVLGGILQESGYLLVRRGDDRVARFIVHVTAASANFSTAQTLPDPLDPLSITFPTFQRRVIEVAVQHHLERRVRVHFVLVCRLAVVPPAGFSDPIRLLVVPFSIFVVGDQSSFGIARRNTRTGYPRAIDPILGLHFDSILRFRVSLRP